MKLWIFENEWRNMTNTISNIYFKISQIIIKDSPLIADCKQRFPDNADISQAIPSR